MLADTTPQDDVVIACDPSSLTPTQMKHWVEDILPQVYKAVQEIQELPDGYAFRLPSTPETLMLVAEDLNMERECCPFVRFTLEIEPNHGSFWLRMTGREGVKAFLQMNFEAGSMFDEKVASAVGFNISSSTALDSVETVLETVEAVNARFARTVGSK